MNRSTRRTTVAATVGAPVAALVLALSGCVAWTPQTAASPYEAGDGSNAQVGGRGEIGGIKLRNFLLVSEEEGAPGVLVGGILNETGEPVQVQLQVQPAAAGVDQPTILAQRTVDTRPDVLTQVGGNGTVQIQVPSVPLPPGALLSLVVQTPLGGTRMSLPILPPAGAYSVITPTAASPSPSPTASGGATASPSPSESGEPAATPSPDESGGATATASASPTESG